jgi:hypothetical protein
LKGGVGQGVPRLWSYVFGLGRRQEIIPPDCAGFGFVCKAQPPVHITGYGPVDVTPQTGAKTSKVVALFLACAIEQLS